MGEMAVAYAGFSVAWARGSSRASFGASVAVKDAQSSDTLYFVYSRDHTEDPGAV